MKRINLLTAGLLGLALLLVACGDTATPTISPITKAASSTTAPVAATTAVNSPAPTTAATTSAASSETADATGFPVTVTDSTGTAIAVQKKVEKISCHSETCFEMLYVLGLVPYSVAQARVGSAWLNEPTLFGNQFKDMKLSGGGNGLQPNLEDLAKVKPDLIVGFTGLAPLRAATANIAPMYLPSDTQTDYNQNLHNLTGRENQAEAAVKRYEDKLTDYKAKSPKNKSAVNFYYYFVPPYAMTAQTSPGAALNDLAVYPWQPQAGGSSPSVAQISLEELLKADPDFIFVGNYSSLNLAQEQKDTTLKARTDLESNTFWKELKDVKNKQVYEVDNWKIAGGGSFSVTSFMDSVMPIMYPDTFPKALPYSSLHNY